MNLTKALKQKKKLIKQVDNAFIKFSTFNSYEVGTLPIYDPQRSYDDWVILTNELIELKAKIQRANAPIIDKIFRLGELKNMVSRIRGIDTTIGIKRERHYGITNEQSTQYDAFMSLVSRDKQIQSWEDEIEQLQEEIELFNVITKI